MTLEERIAHAKNLAKAKQLKRDEEIKEVMKYINKSILFHPPWSHRSLRRYNQQL